MIFRAGWTSPLLSLRASAAPLLLVATATTGCAKSGGDAPDGAAGGRVNTTTSSGVAGGGSTTTTTSVTTPSGTTTSSTTTVAGGCGAGWQLCSGNCFHIDDASNCGTCGNACPTGSACEASSDGSTATCVCETAGTTACAGACVDLSTDANNCGSCGHDCGQGSCNAGACTCDAAPASVTLCGTPTAGSCIDTAADTTNCGACGKLCGTNFSCEGGNCTCPSDGQHTACGSGASAICTVLATDRTNCGSCGRICSSDQVCVSGTCKNPCDEMSACAGRPKAEITVFDSGGTEPKVTNAASGTCYWVLTSNTRPAWPWIDNWNLGSGGTLLINGVSKTTAGKSAAPAAVSGGYCMQYNGPAGDYGFILTYVAP